MAEFCVACWNDMLERTDDETLFVLSKELELCEGCPQMKHIIVKIRFYKGRKIRVFLRGEVMDSNLFHLFSTKT